MMTIPWNIKKYYVTLPSGESVYITGELITHYEGGSDVIRTPRTVTDDSDYIPVIHWEVAE